MLTPKQRKFKTLIETLVKKELKSLKEDNNIDLTLKCINPGHVQTMTGEARSMNIFKGQKVKVYRENQYFYFGKLIDKAYGRLDPNLSGHRNIDTTKIHSMNDIEIAINKNDQMNNDSDDFWAGFEIVNTNESLKKNKRSLK